MGLLRGASAHRNHGVFGSSQTAQASDFCISSPRRAERGVGVMIREGQSCGASDMLYWGARCKRMCAVYFFLKLPN